MAHIHDVYDQDNHFVIDPITRDITSQSEKVSITQYDHNSERFTFEIPKIIEGHDMSLSDKVRVHFINIGSNRSNVSKGVYEVDDIRVSSDDSDTLLFSWLISRAATEYSGKLNFSIRFYCISDDNIVDYSWATSIFTGIKISNSIDNSEAIAEDYVDILEQWKSEIAIKIDDIDSKIENIKIPEIPTQLPNPQSLTFTGAAEGTYDGSSALTVDIPSAPEIPTKLPNPQSLTFTGAVNASYDGSSEMSVKIPGALSDLSEDAAHRFVTDAEKAKWNAKSNFSGSYNDLTDKPTIPDVPVQSVNGKTGAVVLSAEDVGALPGSTVIPEALPNPNALIFTGAVEGTYDGSNPLAVEIPSVPDIPDISGKMDKNNPTGTGSFSLNRKPGTTIGINSHAEGNNNTASGDYSHAEGDNTTASGSRSHAEGLTTTAASSEQHVQGRHNVEDASGVYADIIGNGSYSKKSNAATVDWSGNAWYAGDVYVGSTSGINKDSGSKKLATEEYVDNSTASIEIPQSDWNQNDSSAANYIQNRPFYKEETVGYSIEEQTLEFVTTDCSGIFLDLTLGIANIPNSFDPSVGEDLTVVFDGVEYELRVEASSIPVISAYIGHDEMPQLIGSVTPFTFYKDFNFVAASIDFTPTGSWTLFTSELTPASHTIAVKK